MKEPKVLVTMKDIQRYRIIQDVLEKKLKATSASQILGLSYIHLLRLKKKTKEHGFQGILRKGREAPNKIPDKLANKVVDLRRRYYHDFNIMHFKDKLKEIHKLHLSYETLRQILIKHGLHIPKKRRIIHRMRRRMPKAGFLVQMDSSQHRWLEHIKEPWWLIATVDDATNEVAYGRFFPKDTLFANMHVLRRLIERKGIFYSLYVDKASHFKTTRHGGLHYNVAQDQEETQIERALEELGINIIPANSPQAKGRIEVTFRLFQDRLIKEMRLAGTKNYEEANRFLLDKFLPWYNSRFIHEAESAYMPVPCDKKLDLIFCIKKERIVNNDNTVQIYGQIIQIMPSKLKRTFAKSKVDVCLLEDKRIFVLYKGSVITEAKLSKNNKVIQKEKKIEKLLNNREYVFVVTKPRSYKPQPANHPWHSFRLKGTKYFKRLTFENSKKLTY
ncbi:MAG: ISNCY family transposase [Candidatus Omnitrophota bacterium]